MPKYHISPKTGRPNMCYASVRSCPIGGENEHYATKEEAREGFEKQMQQSTVAPVVNKNTNSSSQNLPLTFCTKCKQRKEIAYRNPGLGWKYCKECAQNAGIYPVDAVLGDSKTAGISKAPSRAELQEESNRIMDSMIANAKAKGELLKQPQSDFDATLKKMKALDSESQMLSRQQAAVDEKLRTIAKQEAAAEAEKKASFNKMMKEVSPEVYYSDKARVKEVMETGGGVNKTETSHYSLNAGRLNPMSFEGTGNEYFEEGKNSIVILAEADGKSPRAISGWGDSLQNPSEELGRRASQTKMQGGGWRADVVRDNLRVLGFVAADGTRHGWIPNKQIAFFVYK